MHTSNVRNITISFRPRSSTTHISNIYSLLSLNKQVWPIMTRNSARKCLRQCLRVYNWMCTFCVYYYCHHHTHTKNACLPPVKRRRCGVFFFVCFDSCYAFIFGQLTSGIFVCIAHACELFEWHVMPPQSMCLRHSKAFWLNNRHGA